MTTETRTLIGVAVGGLLLGAGLLYLILQWGLSSDEEGIRVKNGSVDLETVSKEGFAVDTANPSKKFKLKRNAKGAVHIAVYDGACKDDKFFVANAYQIVLHVEDPTAKVDLVANGALVLSAFKDKGDLTQLTLDGTITAIQVFDSAGNSELRCEKDSNKYLQAYLHISKK